MIKRKESFDSTTDNRKAWIGTPSSQSSLGATAVISSQANTTAKIYASVAAALIVALSPALFFSFGYHNDFNAWAYDTHRCCTRHPETQILMSIGRYFGAYAQNLQFWTIHSLSDLWIWRLVGIISAAALALYYLHIVSLRRPPTWQNACLTVAIFTLPTMQFQAIWVSMYMFWTPPILLSLVAADLLLRATERAASSDRIAVRDAAAPLVLAFLSLLTGFFFYPISATFVLVPAAHLLLSENTSKIRRMALLAVACVGAAFVTLFVVHKFIVLPHLRNVPYLGDYVFTFSSAIVTDAVQRLSNYVQEGAFLWLGLDIPEFQEMVGLAAAIGALYCAMRLVRGSLKAAAFSNFIMICCLFVAAAAPLLIVHQYSNTYRIMFTMTAIELLALFWLLKQLPLRGITLALVLAGIGAVFAFVSVYGTALSSHVEYDVDARAVARLPAEQFHAIAQIRPIAQRTAFGFDLRNDFGALSPINHVFDLLIGLRYRGDATFDVETARPAGDDSDSPPLVLEKNATVIDLSPIYGWPKVSNLSQFATVSAQPRGQFGPMNAVDGVDNTFWEVCGQPFPITLTLEYPSAHTLLGYDLSTIETPERMPRRWEVWATSKESSWHKLQEVADARPWGMRENRHFDVEFVPDVTGIKLVILETQIGSCLRLYEFRPAFEVPPETN